MTHVNIFTFFPNNVNLIMLNPNQANGCYFARVAYHAFILRGFYLYSDLILPPAR